jgi:hypothetical protein
MFGNSSVAEQLAASQEDTTPWSLLLHKNILRFYTKVFNALNVNNMSGRGKLRSVAARWNPFRPKSSGRRRPFLFIIGVFFLCLHSYYPFYLPSALPLSLIPLAFLFFLFILFLLFLFHFSTSFLFSFLLFPFFYIHSFFLYFPPSNRLLCSSVLLFLFLLLLLIHRYFPIFLFFSISYSSSISFFSPSPT